MTRWRRTRCANCNGTGLVSCYVGVDFAGAEGCGDCHGSGRHYISEGGTLALYPGGPFCGSNKSLFAKCDPTTECTKDDFYESEFGHTTDEALSELGTTS